MDPVTAIFTRRTYPTGGGDADARRPLEGAGRQWCGCVCGAGTSVVRVRQLKLSPQAQELPALGLSMVKPCFSMVSAKSIVAPSR
jgi:hypothetical protein